MKFNYVKACSVEVPDNDFNKMIELLREYDDGCYEDVIYQVLEYKYTTEMIEEVESLIIPELMKRDLKDKEEGNVYFNTDDFLTIQEFFDLVDILFEKSKKGKSRLEILLQLYEMRDKFTDATGIMKMKF